jgi:hypothetical protein
MDLITVIYLADVVEGATRLLLYMTTLSFLASCALGIGVLYETGIKITTYFATLIFSIVVGFITVAIPSKQAIYMMAGAKVVQDISKDPRIQNTLDKIYKIIDNKLDEQLVKGEKK